MRSASLGPEAQMHLKIPDRRARPGGRTARRMRGIIRIGGQSLPPRGGEFHGIRLAQYDGPGAPHHRDRRRVPAHFERIINRRVLRRRSALRSTNRSCRRQVSTCRHRMDLTSQKWPRRSNEKGHYRGNQRMLFVH